MAQFSDNNWFETETCCNCGIQFAITTDFQKRRLKDRKSFYCPAGHEQHYIGKSEEQKLKEKLSQKERELQRESSIAEAAQQRAKAVNKQYKRIRDRVKNGVCPCCNRSFTKLADHIKTKHPKFGSHDLLKSLRTAYGLTQTKLAEEIWIKPNYISLYENNKPVPEETESRIDSWLAEQVA